MPSGIAGSAGTWVLGTFAAYLLVLLGIGLYSSQLMDTVDDYVIGGREVGPVVTGFSERASEMSGWLTLGVPGDAYNTGVMAFYNALGMIPADLFAWAGMAKRLRKYSEIVRAVTLPTFFATRLQDDTGLVKGVSAVMLMLFEGGYVGAQIVAAGTLLQVLTGVSPLVGILAGGVIVVGYTMLGGYFAVAWSDYFQGAIILAAFILLPVLAFTSYGLPFDDLAAMGGGLSSVTAGMTGWAAVFGIISYAAIGLGIPGNPHVMVRFMGIDEVENIRLAAVVAQLFMFVAYIGAGFVGLYGLVVFGGGISNTDNVMPMLTIDLFPGWLAGIILAAALAAMMSSADSQLLVATSAVVEDVYHGFIDPDAGQEKLVRYSQLVTLALGAGSIMFAYLAKDTPIYTLVLDYAWGGLGAAIGPTLIAALWWKRVTATGAVASMLVGSSTMVLWTQLSTLLGVLGLSGLAEGSGFLASFLGVYGLFPAFILSMLVLVVVSLLTQPPEGVDEHFDIFDKPLSTVVEEDTPDYATDGGRDYAPKAVTETDTIRAHVDAADYWEE
ncbi:sodium/proline symporter (plasmid) [Halarchaeum sp. CBA1220]|uniref:sodium/proline symporter n=1 Tax=Halarchaeum sp. CBA1220 TaxID=1853682 RepID=UPI000F3A9A59|nr:sodium/proline symporter [Halarchaeum sp. CBA1220]QLC34867.1 sodium/proline symporter [Halarchaeum sp. CBA1220]